tara:strand:- start:2585 stop:3298 length:714 start_codon:yes stop_codon:yes gene_type:complete
MDLDLPELDIVEDIAEIMDDEGESVPQKIISEDEHQKQLEIEEEKKQPFVKKTAPKKKKELSEKQLAHLDKIRGMALEKRKTKARARKEAVDKAVSEISEEHKPKYYKPKPKKTPEEKAIEKEAKKKYKKRTIEVNEEIPQELEEKTPEDFVPSHKAEVKQKKEKELFNQQDSFNHFMGNMEMYLKLRDEHEQKKEKPKVVPKSPIKKEPTKYGTLPQPPPTILQPIDENPFSNYFG